MNMKLLIGLFLFCLGLGGCSLVRVLPSEEPDTATGPRGKAYTVLGKTYRPLLSAAGFREEGIASWYGRDFHGKKTANGEIYNMYAMTAAHKILPLGTVVRVKHLGNGRSIVVRVNDRGPFVSGRIIDLSYTAAKKLGMIGSGTARVRLEALSGQSRRASAGSGIRNTGIARSNIMFGKGFYVQLTALSDPSAAATLVNELRQSNLSARSIFVPSRSVWRIQAGPFSAAAQAEATARRLVSRFPGCYVVRE